MSSQNDETDTVSFVTKIVKMGDSYMITIPINIIHSGEIDTTYWHRCYLKQLEKQVQIKI